MPIVSLTYVPLTYVPVSAKINMNAYWAVMDDIELNIEILPDFDLLPSYTDETGKKVVTGTVKEAFDASMSRLQEYIEYKLNKYITQVIFTKDMTSKIMTHYGGDDVWGYLHDCTLKYATKYPSRIRLTDENGSVGSVHSDSEEEEDPLA